MGVELNFIGVIVAVAMFLVIGLFHPIVIKAEYHFGVKCWWIFLLLGIVSLIASLLINNLIVSMLMGVLGITFLWSIIEIFEQRKRVEKGWFPEKPKRKK